MAKHSMNGKLIKWMGLTLVSLGLLVSGVLAHHYFRASSVRESWKPGHPPVTFTADVHTLEILPLVNFQARPESPSADVSYGSDEETSNDGSGYLHRNGSEEVSRESLNDKLGLRAEVGVSYLIRTDQGTVLFDLGHNPQKTNPSALVHNMEQTGVQWEDLDAIFLSHTHFDHVGELDTPGSPFYSFLESTKKSIPLYTPQALELEPLRNYLEGMDVGEASLMIQETPRAQEILPGIATTGGIPRQLFIGYIEEQALVINVRGKGLVLIVGCGHQTLERLLIHVRKTFSQPIYGIVGDLHLPVPDGRMNPLGINGQRIFASGEGPLHPLSEPGVRADLEKLKKLNPGLVALGTHDSSDDVVRIFAEEFGERYRFVRVGEWILVE
tara:strand:+ start:53218 stop:54369 length:1152 start_codon:yes stop_codon:yes gene_type:complete